jgi:hypothetical protein
VERRYIMDYDKVMKSLEGIRGEIMDALIDMVGVDERMAARQATSLVADAMDLLAGAKPPEKPVDSDEFWF